MSKEMEFFIFLLEQYADYKKVTTDVVLKQWDAMGLTDLIFGMYERYHTEALENAFDDIEELSAEKKCQYV